MRLTKTTINLVNYESSGAKIQRIWDGKVSGLGLEQLQRIPFELGLPSEMVYRHPLPGPRLGVRIINEINGISRVTYDISGKPSATIEWK